MDQMRKDIFAVVSAAQKGDGEIRCTPTPRLLHLHIYLSPLPLLPCSFPSLSSLSLPSPPPPLPPLLRIISPTGMRNSHSLLVPPAIGSQATHSSSFRSLQ
eukprot:364757-Hanusia_phi.AAC.2